MLRGRINVTVRHCLIVIHAVHLRRLASLFAHVQTIVGTEDLACVVFSLLAETFVLDVRGLLPQPLLDVIISGVDVVLMSHNTLLVLDSPFIIQLTLLLLLGMQVLLVPVHQGLIFLATLLHLISEFRVFLSDTNLLLQTLLFIVQLAKAILKHHSLQAFRNGNFTKSPFIERELTSICLCLS